jgi:opacity protein-like surface antigen
VSSRSAWATYRNLVSKNKTKQKERKKIKRNGKLEHRPRFTKGTIWGIKVSFACTQIQKCTSYSLYQKYDKNVYTKRWSGTINHAEGEDLGRGALVPSGMLWFLKCPPFFVVLHYLD